MLNSRFCKRIWAGLGVLALVLLFAGPRLGWVVVLPALACLACCVPMLFMMRGTSSGTSRSAWITVLRRGIERLIRGVFR